MLMMMMMMMMMNMEQIISRTKRIVQLVLFAALVQWLVVMLFQFDMAFVFCAWHYI